MKVLCATHPHSCCYVANYFCQAYSLSNRITCPILPCKQSLIKKLDQTLHIYTCSNIIRHNNHLLILQVNFSFQFKTFHCVIQINKTTRKHTHHCKTTRSIYMFTHLLCLPVLLLFISNSKQSVPGCIPHTSEPA